MTNNERKECISALRQLLVMCDFVDQYGDCIDADPYFNAVETAIESLNETGWIPVSERLPEKDERVLVTAWGDVDIAWIDKYGLWQTEEYTYHSKDDVLAWMPLPETYDCGAKMGGESE